MKVLYFFRVSSGLIDPPIPYMSSLALLHMKDSLHSFRGITLLEEACPRKLRSFRSEGGLMRVEIPWALRFEGPYDAGQGSNLG